MKYLNLDDRTFSSAGSILCGRPFVNPMKDMRFVQNIFFQPDDSFNQDEVDAMPSKYNRK